MTFHVFKHSPQYRSPEEHIEYVGHGADTVEECIEILRQHFLECNQRIVDMAISSQVPECILNLARKSIKHNPYLDIVIKKDDRVFVDGVGPEMDYYTITEEEL